jgi:hypothetical protein
LFFICLSCFLLCQAGDPAKGAAVSTVKINPFYSLPSGCGHLLLTIVCSCPLLCDKIRWVPRWEPPVGECKELVPVAACGAKCLNPLDTLSLLLLGRGELFAVPRVPRFNERCTHSRLMSVTSCAPLRVGGAGALHDIDFHDAIFLVEMESQSKSSPLLAE